MSRLARPKGSDGAAGALTSPYGAASPLDGSPTLRLDAAAEQRLFEFRVRWEEKYSTGAAVHDHPQPLTGGEVPAKLRGI